MPDFSTLQPLTALLVATTLTACASAHRDVPYDPSASQALNIVRAAALDGLNDQPSQALPGPSGGVGIGEVGLAAAPVFTPPPGFSPAGAGAMGLIFLLSTPPAQAHPAKFMHVYAWVPGSLANSPEAAQAAIEAAVLPALTKTVDPSDLVEREAWQNPPLGPRSTTKVLTTPDCPEIRTERKLSFDYSCSGNFGVVAAKTAMDDLAEERAPPAFLAGVASTTRGPTIVQIRATGIFGSRLLSEDKLEAFSALLPPWIFIYLPPRAGKPPVVLSAGRTLRFEKPQPETH
jgi:hypothetical protein